jgi:hypothetical protein
MANKNKRLHTAKAVKNDEFYTQLTDIEKELSHYKDQFFGKTVLCNCDDPRVSNFFKYFAYNFEKLGLKKLITTCYKSNMSDLFSRYDSDKAIYLEYTGDQNDNRTPDVEEIEVIELKGDGDFRSEECIQLLKQADIVCTNPPFSLFREYIAQLFEYNKKFLIIGNKNCVTYKGVFQQIMNNKMWLGYRNINADMWFVLPDNAEKWEKIEDGKKLKHIMGCWLTNLEVSKRHENMILYKNYTPEEYPKYDNYNAINVNIVKDIPLDYEGAMGVPITFLDKYNPDQFEILGCSYSYGEPVGYHKEGTDFNVSVAGKPFYKRLFIKKKL